MKTIALDWVCTADENTLHAAKYHAPTGAVTEMLWRRIEVKGDARAILLELRQVDGDNATGNPGASSDASYGFGWEDLDDQDFLCKMVAHELFCVGVRVLRLLTALRMNRAALIKKLTPRPPTLVPRSE